MSAPTTTCAKTTVVVRAASVDRADPSLKTSGGPTRGQPSPVTTASVTERQKKICAKQACATETASGSR